MRTLIQNQLVGRPFKMCDFHLDFLLSGVFGGKHVDFLLSNVYEKNLLVPFNGKLLFYLSTHTYNKHSFSFHINRNYVMKSYIKYLLTCMNTS